MASRPIWKGDLKLSLVTVPVKLFSASEASAKVAFNRLHDECKHQTSNKIHCDHCKKDIPSTACVKGYEVTKGQHVIFSEEELKSLEDETSGVMEITTVMTEPINPLFVDGTLLLMPDDGAQQAFATLRLGLGDRLAGGTITMRGKPSLVALQATNEGFLVYKLRGAEQVRTFSAIQPTLNVVPPAQDVALAKQLLNQLEGEFAYTTARNIYRDRVLEAAQAKANGTALPVTAPPSAAASFSLSDALSKSLALAAEQKAEQKKAKLPERAAKSAKAQPKAAQKRKSA